MIKLAVWFLTCFFMARLALVRFAFGEEVPQRLMGDRTDGENKYKAVVFALGANFRCRSYYHAAKLVEHPTTHVAMELKIGDLLGLGTMGLPHFGDPDNNMIPVFPLVSLSTHPTRGRNSKQETSHPYLST